MQKIKSKISAGWSFIKERFSKDGLDTTYYESRSNKPAGYILMGAMALLNFVIYYQYAECTLLSGDVTDLSCHAGFAQNYYMDPDLFLAAWLRVPYMFWHLCVKFFESRMGFPLFEATAFVYASFGLFCFCVTAYFLFRLIKVYTDRESYAMSAVGAFFLAFVGPYQEWWATTDLYYGQFSANPFHNPTHMAVKGFGLIVAMLGIDIIRRIKGQATLFFSARSKLYVWFGIFLFMSTFTKPTFMYMLLPSGFIYLVAELIAGFLKKDSSPGTVWSGIWRLSVASIPSILLLLSQYYAFYLSGTAHYESGVVISSPLEVWHMYSFNVPLSIMLGMFFPIWMLLTNAGYFIKTVEGRLAVICYAVGTLEFTFLKEAGEKASAANFGWCMMAGMVVFFSFAVAKLIQETYAAKQGKAHVIYITAGWFFLLMHVYSGIMLINKYFEIF